MDEIEPQDLVVHPGLRRVVALVALLNIGYFGVEFAVATTIGSVSLFADSVDFFEDAAVSLLVLWHSAGPRGGARWSAWHSACCCWRRVSQRYGPPGRRSARPSRPRRFR